MNNLIKIRDVSSKYDITARTLRYYEDMGLLSSTRSDDYKYRMYDENAVRRLEQILILRKLNISIKDIQSVFNTSGTDVVLEVLGKKVERIDDEVALLHELKGIVLDFIHEIEQVNFADNSDIKLLYNKAKEIEIRSYLRSVKQKDNKIIIDCIFGPAGTIRVDEILCLLGLRAEQLTGPVKRLKIIWQ